MIFHTNSYPYARKSKAMPKILLAGIGAIGGVMAYYLSDNAEIFFITNNEDISNAITESITLSSEEQTKQIPEDRVFTTSEEISPDLRFDAIILLMKTTQAVEAVKGLKQFLAENGVFVSAQNGYIEEALLKILQSPQLIPLTVGWGATMLAPGRYEKTTPGAFHIGTLQDDQASVVLDLHTVLNQVAPVDITNNIIGVKWAKLAINATINSIGVLTGEPLGKNLSDKKAREIALQIYAEVVDVATANNIELVKVAANPMLLYRPKDAGWMKRLIKDIIVRVVGFKYRHQLSSSYQSLLRGRKTEVDALNGFVSREGKKVRLDTPANDLITKMIHEIEEKKREISHKNIDELYNLLVET